MKINHSCIGKYTYSSHGNGACVRDFKTSHGQLCDLDFPSQLFEVDALGYSALDVAAKLEILWPTGEPKRKPTAF